MRNQSLKGEKMEIESLYLLRCTFYSSGSPPLLGSLCSIFYSSFAFQMEMTEFSDDWRFEFQKMHRCLLTDSTLRKSGLSECIWVGSIKPNGNSNGKATVTTNKRKPILGFWGLQTLFLQKSRICSWHLPTQWFKITEKVPFNNNAREAIF